jgi:hypothetical protein
MIQISVGHRVSRALRYTPHFEVTHGLLQLLRFHG